jgi:hypothetical protein
MAASVQTGDSQYGNYDDLGFILLGSITLSRSYLGISWEDNQFSLAPINLETVSSNHIQTVCSHNTSVPSPSPTAKPTKSSPHLSTGDTIGVVCTVIAFIALIITFLMWKFPRFRLHRGFRLNDALESQLEQIHTNALSRRGTDIDPMAQRPESAQLRRESSATALGDVGESMTFPTKTASFPIGDSPKVVVIEKVDEN